jgi:hypothetical protein
MLVFNKYFYKNKKAKLYFIDCIDVLIDFIYQTGGVFVIQESIVCCKQNAANLLDFVFTATVTLGALGPQKRSCIQ